MQVIVGTDYAALCAIAADRIEKQIREKPDCRLGLATGSSPLGISSAAAGRRGWIFPECGR